jgi:hypothetical protein
VCREGFVDRCAGFCILSLGPIFLVKALQFSFFRAAPDFLKEALTLILILLFGFIGH